MSGVSKKGEAMKIYEYTPGLKISGNRVVALGFFDGVHIGHRALLSAAKEEAKKKAAAFAVFTFFAESPGIKGAKARIYSTEEKLTILESLGAEEIILADFSAVMNISAEDFVRLSLIEDMNAATAVCGKDFRFGKGAEGNTDMLSSIMSSEGKDTLTVGDECLFGRKVSTTAIKEYLFDKDIKKANEMLGEPLFISGTVEHGLGLGKSFGFPTVNTEIPEKEGLIRRGVYISLAEIDGKRYDALTNVGVCPTVSDRSFHAETYVIDQNIELYGRSVRIYLLEFLREEKKFKSKDELIMQIKVDIETAKGRR